MKKIRGGIEVFNNKHQRFGGHWQNLAKITKLDYLQITFGLWNFSYDHEYYEGQHHWLTLGIIRILWGGPPVRKEK